jgi:hypothetical protein
MKSTQALRPWRLPRPPKETDVPREMLVAVTSGIVPCPYRGFFEITAGKTRVAPECLAEQPELEDYFERGVSAAGSDSERSVVRLSPPPTLTEQRS